MKIGMPTFYEFHSLEENLIFGHKNKVDFIELNLNFPYIKNAVFKETNKTFVLLNKYNLSSTIHFYDEADFACKETNKVYLKLFKKACKKGKILGSKNINIHMNLGSVVTVNGIKNYIYKENYDEFINTLEKCLVKMNKIAVKNKMNLVIENIKGEDFIVDAFNKLNGRYNFTYDIGHDYTSNSALKNFFFKCENLKEMHIHDSDEIKDHLPFGKGSIKLDEYFKLAKDKYAVFEVKESKAFIESLAYYKNYLKKSA